MFPGKTFAFVNFVMANHAIAAKAALDGQLAPAITGTKPLVIRFQKDTSMAPGTLSHSSSAGNLAQSSSTGARGLGLGVWG